MEACSAASLWLVDWSLDWWESWLASIFLQHVRFAFLLIRILSNCLNFFSASLSRHPVSKIYHILLECSLGESFSDSKFNSESLRTDFRSFNIELIFVLSGQQESRISWACFNATFSVFFSFSLTALFSGAASFCALMLVYLLVKTFFSTGRLCSLFRFLA